MPDEILKKLYISKEFAITPCIFQTMFLDALERVLSESNYKIVKEDKNDATISKS